MSTEEQSGTPDPAVSEDEHAAGGPKTGFLHGPFRVEALFFLGLGAFFLIVALIYWFWGYHWINGPEQSGTAMLIGTFLLGMLPGSYFIWWSRRMRLRVEDREDATMEEGAGVIDAFPSSSIWPFVLGMGAFVTVLSLVFGFWLTAMGVPLILTALIGVTAESRRGGNV
jgi:hypothetical protein